MNNIPALFKSNSFYILFDKIVKIISGLVAVSIIARSLGVDNFGEFNSLLAIAALFIPLASLGMNKLIIKEISDINESQSKGELLTTAIFFRFFFGLFLSLLTHFYFNNLAFSFFIFSQAFLAFQLCELSLQYQEQFKLICKFRALITLIFAFLKCLVVLEYPQVSIVLCLFAFETLTVELMILAVFFKKSDFALTFNVNMKQGFRLLRKSFLLMLSAFLSVIYLKMDVVMLEKLHSTYEAGIYSAASRVSEAWIFIPTVMLARYFPVLLKIKLQNSVLFNKTLQFLMDKTLLLGLCVVVTVNLFAELIITVIYGESYVNSILILQLHIVATVFIALRVLVSQWLIIHEQFMLSVCSHLLGAVTNLILNFWLIPSHGALGATVATIFAYLTASYLVLFLSTKSTELMYSISLSLAFVFRLRTFLSLNKPWLSNNIKL